MTALPEVDLTSTPTASESTPDAAVRASALIGKIAASKPLESPLTEEAARLALELDPTNTEALNALGRVALKRKEWSAAYEHFHEACAIGAEIGSFVNASLAADMAGDLKSAQELAEMALEAEPECVTARLQLYGIHCQRGDYGEATRTINEGWSVSHDSAELKFARAELLLRKSDDIGWYDYEYRPSRLSLVAHMDEYPEWKGESLEGKTLLVMREQGFGDEIMFARYLPELRKQAGRVVIFTYPDLARLMAPLVGPENVITRECDVPDFDYWIASGSLPLRLGSPQSLDTPLFQPTSGGLAAPRVVGQNLRVGLRWAGNPKHVKDRFRSFSFDVLRPLLDIPGCDFYSLQDGEPAAQSDIPNLPAYCHDVADLAEAINQLDVVVTCDTMVAHLAGSLGKKTFVLVDKCPDWRWAFEWYPSVTVISDREQWISDIDQALLINATYCSTGAYPHRHLFPPPNPPVAQVRTAYGPMRYLANDKYIGRSLALMGEYSGGEIDILQKILKRGDVVVEAGANIGALSGEIAAVIGPEGFLYAYEPQPEYFSLLAQNIEPWSNTLAVNMALGDKRGTVNIPGVETETVSAPSWENETDHIQVHQTTIDACALERLDLLKVDVDKQEHDILRGAEKTIDLCRPIIFVESDKPHLYPDMIPWIAAKNYRIYQTYPAMWRPDNFAGNPVNVFGNLVSSMLLCIPQERTDLRTDTLGIPGLQRVRLKAGN